MGINGVRTRRYREPHVFVLLNNLPKAKNDVLSRVQHDGM